MKGFGYLLQNFSPGNQHNGNSKNAKRTFY